MTHRGEYEDFRDFCNSNQYYVLQTDIPVNPPSGTLHERVREAEKALQRAEKQHDAPWGSLESPLGS